MAQQKRTLVKALVDHVVRVSCDPLGWVSCLKSFKIMTPDLYGPYLSYKTRRQL